MLPARTLERRASISSRDSGGIGGFGARGGLGGRGGWGCLGGRGGSSSSSNSGRAPARIAASRNAAGSMPRMERISRRCRAAGPSVEKIHESAACGNSSCAPAAVTRIRRFIDATNYLDTQLSYGTGPNFELETITLPDGHQIGLAYYTLTAPPANPTTPADFLAIAKNGRLFEIHHQPGGTPIPEMQTNYAYDESGFVASVTRPVDVVQGDAVTQYLRDDLGRIVQLTDALGDLTKATYTGPDGTTPRELLTLLETGASTTDRGRRQKLAYDARGRLLEVQRCIDYATTCGSYQLFRRFGYDSESQRLFAEDFTENPPGALVARRTKLFYDLLGRVRRIEDPTSRATVFEYDERANLTKRTDALSHITQWTYDALDRMAQETNAINGLTQLGYDAAGNVTSVKDPEQSTTSYGYDGLSRLVSVAQPLGQTVRYES